jgi:hypothetical protein
MQRCSGWCASVEAMMVEMSNWRGTIGLMEEKSCDGTKGSQSRSNQRKEIISSDYVYTESSLG